LLTSQSVFSSVSSSCLQLHNHLIPVKDLRQERSLSCLRTNQPYCDVPNRTPACTLHEAPNRTNAQEESAGHGVPPSVRRPSARRHDRHYNIGRRLQCVQQQRPVWPRHQRVWAMRALSRMWQQQQRHRAFAGDILWPSKCCAQGGWTVEGRWR